MANEESWPFCGGPHSRTGFAAVWATRNRCASRYAGLMLSALLNMPDAQAMSTCQKLDCASSQVCVLIGRKLAEEKRELFGLRISDTCSVLSLNHEILENSIACLKHDENHAFHGGRFDNQLP